MATRTSCATSVATFGRAKAARRRKERHRGSSQDILSLWSFLLLPPQLVLSYYAAKNRNDVDSDSEGDVVRPVPAAARQTANETWRGCNGKPAIGFQLQTARGDATFQLNSSVCVSAHTYVCSASVCAPDLSTYLATTSPLLCLCTLSLLPSFALSRIAGSVERCQGQHSRWQPFNAMQQNSCKNYIAKKKSYNLWMYYKRNWNISEAILLQICKINKRNIMF